MMLVELIAKTQLALVAVRRKLDDFESADPDLLHEYAGRLCYKSFHKPNPETATNATYLERSIIGNQHFSVLEHASVSFHVAGVSRSLLTELERHRHLSFSVVSQRFVDSSDVKFVVPPAIRDRARIMHPDMPDAEIELQWQMEPEFRDAIYAYNVTVEELTEHGATRKEAREAARAYLPNCTETEFIVTGNMRTWREIIGKRTAPGADREIQQFANKVDELLKGYAPNSMA